MESEPGRTQLQSRTRELQIRVVQRSDSRSRERTEDRSEQHRIKQLLGSSYFMTNDYAKAAALLTEVIAVKSQDAALYYPLALSLLKDGKLEAANRVIEQMVAVGGNSPQLHILVQPGALRTW